MSQKCEKDWKKSGKKPQSKPYIVTRWHATLNFNLWKQDVKDA